MQHRRIICCEELEHTYTDGTGAHTVDIYARAPKPVAIYVVDPPTPIVTLDLV